MWMHAWVCSSAQARFSATVSTLATSSMAGSPTITRESLTTRDASPRSA